jgi:hypothetical protein
MWDTMVYFLFITILRDEPSTKSNIKASRPTYPRVRFRDTLCDHFLITFLVTSISTIFALIPKGIKQEVVAEGAQHELIELPLDEFVSIHLMHLILAFSNGSLAPKALRAIQRPLAHILFDW